MAANTAPPPLALFTGALTACLMTQIRAFAKRLRIPIRGVEIKTRLHWEGEQIGREPYVGQPIAFHLDVDIDTDACLLYTSPSPRDATLSRMPSSA